MGILPSRRRLDEGMPAREKAKNLVKEWISVTKDCAQLRETGHVFELWKRKAEVQTEDVQRKNEHY